jgi:hypothetical protein
MKQFNEQFGVLQKNLGMWLQKGKREIQTEFWVRNQVIKIVFEE